MPEILKEVLMLSLAGSVIALAILLIRALLWRKIPARLQYALWALLIIRLMLPVMPSSPISVFNLGMPARITLSAADNTPSDVPGTGTDTASGTQSGKTTGSSNISHSSGTAHDRLTGQTAPVQGAGKTAPFVFDYKTAALVWLLGAGIALLYFLAVNLAVRAGIKRHASPADDRITAAADECRKRLYIKRPVRILCDDRAKSPAAFGLLFPFVIISRQTAEISDPNALRYILMHELTHIKRRDNAINLVLMLLEAVNWFNPVLWYAFYKIREDCEISCDASVLAALGDGERREYGYTIINTLQAMPSRLIPGTAGFAGSFTKRRIVMIAKNKKSPFIWAAAAVVVALLAGLVSMPAMGASGIANPASASTPNSSSGAAGAAGSWYYYVNNSDNLKIYRCHADGTGNEKVTGVQSQYPVMVGQWLYYVNIEDGQRIYKIRPDGTGNTMVSFKCPCTNLAYSGGYLYFCSDYDDESTDCGKLYRMTPDGFALQKLCGDYTGHFEISGNTLFYCNAHDGGRLYKISADGKGRSKISADEVMDDFALSGGYVYYVNHVKAAAAGQIYRMNLAGKGKKAIIGKASQLNVWNGMLYFYSADRSALYKTRLDGTGKTQVPLHSIEETLAFGYVNMAGN